MNYILRLPIYTFFVAVKSCAPLIALIIAAACSHFNERTAKVAEAPRILLADPALINSTALLMPASVNHAYAKGNYLLFWFDTAGLSQPGDSLFHFITEAKGSGLVPDDYHVQKLVELLRDSSDQSKIGADVLLTDAFFSLRSHLKNGRLDPKTYERTDLSTLIDNEGIGLLANPFGIDIKKEFSTLAPGHAHYKMFEKTLQQFLQAERSDSIWIKNVNKLTLAMERLRWMKTLPKRYLQVNIPSFTMRVIERDSIVLSSRVIVGKPDNKTPLLESTITSFIIYPYWHVPRSIAIKEILPAIQYDSNYLSKHNYDVLDKYGNVVNPSTINWLMLYEDNFPYVLRQRDGNENTLGIIKFLFNNPYNVYLHDTNGRRLFSKDMRALSHGCVRVQKATELARYLVKDDNIYITPDDLDQYLSLQQRYKINVVKPIPLFIQYFTVEFENGELRFYEDIYGKDKLMLQSLGSPVDPSKEKYLSGI